MKLRKIQQIAAIINRGFLILWATAIFWFYLGNLINFHQNRIWGKVLIPACFTHSSINNKDFGSFQKTEQNLFSSAPDLDFVGIIENPVHDHNHITLNTGLANYATYIATDFKLVIAGFSFRGPPSA